MACPLPRIEGKRGNAVAFDQLCEACPVDLIFRAGRSNELAVKRRRRSRRHCSEKFEIKIFQIKHRNTRKRLPDRPML